MAQFVQFGSWLTKERYRVYLLFLLLAVLPIVLFSYSAHKLLVEDAANRTSAQNTQIANLASRLVEEQLQQGAVFLRSFTTRPVVRNAWVRNDAGEIVSQLKQAHDLRKDFIFVSAFSVDGTLIAIY